MGSKYLNEILKDEGSDFPNIDSKITVLAQHSNILKTDLKKVLEKESVQFNNIFKETSLIKFKVDELVNMSTVIEDKIEGEIKQEFLSCTEELSSLSYSLKEINFYIYTLDQLFYMNSLISAVSTSMKNQEFFECSKSLKGVEDCIQKLSEKLKPLELFEKLSQEAVLLHEQLLHNVSKIWSDYVNFDVDESEKITEIKLAIEINCKEKLTDILKALYLLESNFIEEKFSSVLLKKVINRILRKKAYANVILDKKAVLVFKLNNKEEKPTYTEIFENLKSTMEFLNSYLNIEFEAEECLLTRVKSFVSNKLGESFIQYYLSDNIPFSLEDLNNYDYILENIENFENSLCNIGLLPYNSTLLNYAKNVQVVFVKKFCQTFLNKARIIMKNDLHDIVISESVTSDTNNLEITQKTILKSKMNIQNDVFEFPRSQISKHAKELVDLINLILNEIEKSMDLCAIHLICTVRNIFEMYTAIVPLHHKKFLESLPQQVALFHNNCLYFAHVLINIATKLGIGNSPLRDYTINLLEEAIVLRSFAAENLEQVVTNQRNQLLCILRDSGYAVLNKTPKLDPSSEKSIRQCMRQLQILKTVWEEILPKNVYNRALAFLIDSLVEELIGMIISVEDISSQTATDMVSGFGIILERAPNLFAEPKEIYRYATKWQKFQEFILVIKGSLRDIDDRWANGMGPLAYEFTAEQIRHMIRALFQNSDRRASLLAKIR